MRPVWNELAYNLESFNPLFTAAVLKVQNTLGSSDYEARDTALAHLIQPLAGEYGLHHSIPLGNTHRQLFAEFYESVTGEQLSELLAQENQPPAAAQALFERMLTDVSTGGGREDPVEQASYALGYNLAVEYLAQYEKVRVAPGIFVALYRVYSFCIARQVRRVRHICLQGCPIKNDFEHNGLGEMSKIKLRLGNFCDLVCFNFEKFSVFDLPPSEKFQFYDLLGPWGFGAGLRAAPLRAHSPRSLA